MQKAHRNHENVMKQTFESGFAWSIIQCGNNILLLIYVHSMGRSSEAILNILLDSYWFLWWILLLRSKPLLLLYLINVGQRFAKGAKGHSHAHVAYQFRALLQPISYQINYNPIHHWLFRLTHSDETSTPVHKDGTELQIKPIWYDTILFRHDKSSRRLPICV